MFGENLNERLDRGGEPGLFLPRLRLKGGDRRQEFVEGLVLFGNSGRLAAKHFLADPKLHPGLDLPGQDLRVDGGEDEVDEAPQPRTAHLDLGSLVGGDEDDRGRAGEGLLPEFHGGFQAVQYRHPDVQENDAEGAVVGELQGSPARFGEEDRIAQRGHHRIESLAVRGAIVHDEDVD